MTHCPCRENEFCVVPWCGGVVHLAKKSVLQSPNFVAKRRPLLYMKMHLVDDDETEDALLRLRRENVDKLNMLQ